MPRGKLQAKCFLLVLTFLIYCNLKYFGLQASLMDLLVMAFVKHFQSHIYDESLMHWGVGSCF